MGDSLNASTERVLASIREELDQISRDFRGASAYGSTRGGAGGAPNLVIETSSGASLGSHPVGTVLGFQSGVWAPAISTLGVYYQMIGILGKVIDATTVLIVVRGVMSLVSFTVDPIVKNQTYYLSKVTAGKHTIDPLDYGTTPNTIIPLFRSYTDEAAGVGAMVWVDGQASAVERTLRDCYDVRITTPVDGDTLAYEGASSLWKNVAPGAASFGSQVANRIFAGPASGANALPTFRDMVIADLPSIAALAVLANATNAAAKPTALAASTTGDVLHMGAAALEWGQLSTASYEDDSVTVAKIDDTGLTTGDVLRMGATAIAWGTLTTASYSDLSVTTAKIDNLAVTTGKINDLAVTTGKIAANAVTTAKMDALIAAGGPTGSASVVPVITYDASGRLTAVTTATITPAAIGAVDTATFSAHTHNLAGDVGGTTAATVIGALKVTTGMIAANAVTGAKLETIITAGSVGSSTRIPRITYDVHGRITLIDDVLAAGGGGTLDGLSDVVITTPADGDVLAYDLGSATWINVAAGAASFGAQNANELFSGPASGAATLPTFRSMVMDDLPSTAAISVIGRSAATAGKPAAITASTTGEVLRMGATTIGWDTLATESYKDDSVTYAKIQNVSATDRLLGRSSAGAGDIEEIVCTSFARSILDDAAASNARLTLELGTIATQNENSVSITGGSITGITDLAITDGGTGAGTAKEALFNLLGMPLGYPLGNTGTYTSPGTYTHTFGGTAKFFLCGMVGGGGSGAGGSTVAFGSTSRGGSGGGGGGAAWFWGRISGFTTMSVTVGAGGAAVAVNSNGNFGGNTSVVVNGNTIRADGGGSGTTTGLGGSGGTSVTQSNGYNTATIIGLTGETGGTGHVVSVAYNGTGNITSIVTSPGGGGMPGWAGPVGGFGGGGDGGAAAATGGAGENGGCWVWEY